MSSKKFIKAEEGKPPGISVVYYDSDGNMTIRHHNKNGKTGSIAWRNNNPGNLAWGSGAHAKKTSWIGKAKGRPVFPDYETGKQSMRLLLKEDFYQLLGIWQEGALNLSQALPTRLRTLAKERRSALLLGKQAQSQWLSDAAKNQISSSFRYKSKQGEHEGARSAN
jgi:hypothetical protein